jgi:hypothetical protein
MGHHVVFWDCSNAGYLREYFDDVTDMSEAALVPVDVGATTSGIDASLAPSAHITGVVRDNANDPVGGICVEASGLEYAGSGYATAVTAADGSYDVPAEPGDTVVRFQPCPWMGGSDLLGEYFDDEGSRAEATTLPAVGGATIASVDATLAIGGTISGTITDELGDPVPHACVASQSEIASDFGTVAFATTDPAGQYVLRGLAPGQHLVSARYCQPPSFVEVFYGDTTDPQLADPIPVSTGSNTPGVDISLLAYDGPPTVGIPPQAGSLRGLADLVATASDDAGVTQVEFSVDGITVGVDSNGIDGWSVRWNSASVGDRRLHSIRATATDTVGQLASSWTSRTVLGDAVGDFDGDGDTDIGVFRPSVGGWYVQDQPTVFFGLSGDIPVPGDYDGNGTTDRAVFRPSVGGWYIEGQPTVFYGLGGDVPVPGDYDGDGITDVAVYRPSVGGWYIYGQPTVYYGLSSDTPVPGDYDGNGTTDPAIYRPSVGGWYVNGQPTVFHGLSSDTPAPGDYDGDGLTDPAVYRGGAWLIRNQGTVYLGLSSDTPTAGDYDGDGLTDAAVYRPGTGAWFINDQPTTYHGLPADLPTPLRRTAP